MAFYLKPNGLRPDGAIRSYTIALPNNALAILDHIVNRGWELTIRLGNAKTEARGLFATPHDIVCVLEVEFPYSLQESRTPRGATISQLRLPAKH